MTGFSNRALFFGREAVRTAGDAGKVSLELFKVMVPILVIVKVLKEYGLIGRLAAPLEPLMSLMGLPAETGLVWATGMVNNIYGAIVVYASLVGDGLTLTTAQVSVLSVVILIAHSLPVETKITQKCGAGLWSQVALRFFSALACGALLHGLFSATGLLAGPSRVLFKAEPADVSLLSWAVGEAGNLAAIYCIILALLVLMRALRALRVTELMEWALAPLLRLVGIGRRAASITVVGLALGITYGSGLILHEIRSGKIGQKDVFASVSLMSLSHALVEDTLLFVLIGADVYVVLLGRLAFSLLVTALLVRVVLPKIRAGKSGLAKIP